MIRSFALLPALVLLACGADPTREIAELRGALDREAAAYLLTRTVRLPDAEAAEMPDRVLFALERAVAESAGAGFERFRSQAFRAAMDELRDYVAGGSWGEEEARRIETALAGLLAQSPRPREAWWGVSLANQREIRDRLAGEPGDGEALEAWRVLREHLDPDAPDLGGLERAARKGGNPLLATAAAEVLLAAERLPAIDEGRKRDLEAVILALHVLDRRRRTGEWPEDLAAVRPETVPASPLGMRWELDTDPVTKAPAIFLRGGKRFGAAQGDPKGFHAAGPEESLFRFQE